jgi:GNAT superfamily N-acetyltransferase
LLLREMTFGYYHELFLGHPDRVARPWAQFLEGLSSLCAEDLFPEPVSTDSGALPTDLPALNALVATAVPDPADRFDLPRFDRPLTGTHFDSAADLQSWVRGHVEADLTRRGDSRYSGDLGAFMSLLRAFGPFSRLLESGRLSLHSQLNDLPRFMNFFSYLASGPPPRRLRELVALSEAGIVTFLGAGSRIWVDRDPAATPVGFAASSVSVPGTVRAAALIEARIPRPSIIHTTDPLVRALHARGELGEQALQDAGTGLSVSTGRVMVTSTFQVIDAAGVPHPRRLAFGAWTSAATAAAFSRPGTNAPFFVQNDAAARQVLRLLQNEIREPVAGTEPAEAAGRRHQGRRGVRAGGVGRGPELRFVSADDPAIPGLLAKIDHEYAGRYPSLSHTTDDAVPLSLLQPPDGALLLAFEDGVCVAAGAFKRYEHAPRTAEIKRVWTDRSQRGRGLARRLLSGLEEEAWQRGYRQVHLTTGPRQPEAQALYLTSGYTPLFDLDSDPELIGLLPFEKSLADADRGSGG